MIPATVLLPAEGIPVGPCYEGYVATTYDALILFEACLSGYLNHVPRRPYGRERENLIRSGAIFIYKECSGIKRWTDGYNWSPSRILGNFLVYRELEGPFPPGEKKRAKKPTSKKQGAAKNETARNHAMMSAVMGNCNVNGNSPLDEQQRQQEELRLLVGSLIDSFSFKMDGLVKKTISITCEGVSHHMVSYYRCEDVMNKRLSTPSTDPKVSHIQPRSQLCTDQNFRSSIYDGSMVGQLQQNGSLDPNAMPHAFALAGFMQAGIPQHPHHYVTPAGLEMPYEACGSGHDFAYASSNHGVSVSGPVATPMDSTGRQLAHITLPMHYGHNLIANSLSAPIHSHNYRPDLTFPVQTSTEDLLDREFCSITSECAYNTVPAGLEGDSLPALTTSTGLTALSVEYKLSEFRTSATDGFFYAAINPFL